MIIKTTIIIPCKYYCSAIPIRILHYTINHICYPLHSKRELKDLALKDNIIHISNIQDMDEYTEQATYVASNKNLIDPLLEWKFITVNKQGAHHIVSVTDEGRNALKFLNVD